MDAELEPPVLFGTALISNDTDAAQEVMFMEPQRGINLVER